MIISYRGIMVVNVLNDFQILHVLHVIVVKLIIKANNFY